MVTINPDDPDAYETATKTVHINVTRVTPIITWPDPSPIDDMTPLSFVQLNAQAKDPTTMAMLAGTYTYTPAEGTTLPVGNGQELDVTFHPTNSAHYNDATATAHIDVTGSGGGGPCTDPSAGTGFYLGDDVGGCQDGVAPCSSSGPGHWNYHFSQVTFPGYGAWRIVTVSGDGSSISEVTGGSINMSGGGIPDYSHDHGATISPLTWFLEISCSGNWATADAVVFQIWHHLHP